MIEIIHQDNKTSARVGKIETKKGIIETPAFVLKTHNLQIKNISGEDLKIAQSQILKTDAFELWKILCDEGLNFSDEIYNILKWNGPVITDSGSLNILKLQIANKKNNWVEITNAGIKFKDAQKGIEDYFDAEKSAWIQEEVGSDIVFAFDLPINWQGQNILEETEKSLKWQMRFLEAKNSNQIILGVLGGGINIELVKKSAQYLNKMTLGGFVFGNWIEKPDFLNILKIIETTLPILNPPKIRYLKNVENISQIFASVKAGIDLFESQLPYSSSKNFIALTSGGKIDFKEGMHSENNSLLDETCQCPVCQEGKTKKELYWQLKLKNKEGIKNLLIHNIYFINNLMKSIKEAIKENKVNELEECFKYLNF